MARAGRWRRGACRATTAPTSIGHALLPLDIVVVDTRAGSRYGQADYLSAGCGVGEAATMYLLQRDVRLTGTDAWSRDAPFMHTAQKYQQSGDASLIWEGHKAGRDIGYCHLDKLRSREALPPHGFYISCFPHKIRGASVGWTRAVAFDERLFCGVRQAGMRAVDLKPSLRRLCAVGAAGFGAMAAIVPPQPARSCSSMCSLKRSGW